jgi:hypothetical protein
MELAKIVPQANKDATREDYLRGKHPCDNAFFLPVRYSPLVGITKESLILASLGFPYFSL